MKFFLDIEAVAPDQFDRVGLIPIDPVAALRLVSGGSEYWMQDMEEPTDVVIGLESEVSARLAELEACVASVASVSLGNGEVERKEFAHAILNARELRKGMEAGV